MNIFLSKKRHGHICDECNHIFTCIYEDLRNHICRVCELQVCDKCRTKHCTELNQYCLDGIYDFKIDSLKRLQNWKYNYIQLCCPKCNQYRIEEFKRIDPEHYICNNIKCITYNDCNKVCLVKYIPFLEYKEEINSVPIMLYKTENHISICLVCEIPKCSCYYHHCKYINISRFYPRIAYIYSKKHVRDKILTILCCFKRILPEIHKDVIWKKIINYLDWTIN